ncbi:MAG: hypothetical protein KY437_05270 [Actinobacteria bacterium]|nr:hypothetical protein [Actinomycetota bacterium]
MIAIEELLETGINPEILAQVEGESILYARGQGEVATILTSRGHLFRVRGDQIEMAVLRPAVSIRTKDSAIAVRTAHGVEAMLFESDPERRDDLFRQLVANLT